MRSEALLVGRWFLAELDAQRSLVRILEHDGDRLPRIRDLVRERIIDEGHRRVEKLLQTRLGELADGLDLAALAVLVIGPLANQRRVTWTYGAPPLGLSDERLLTTWSNTLATLLEAAIQAGTPPKATRRH